MRKGTLSLPMLADPQRAGASRTKFITNVVPTGCAEQSSATAAFGVRVFWLAMILQTILV